MPNRRKFMQDAAAMAGVIFTGCSILDAAPARRAEPGARPWGAAGGGLRPGARWEVQGRRECVPTQMWLLGWWHGSSAQDGARCRG